MKMSLRYVAQYAPLSNKEAIPPNGGSVTMDGDFPKYASFP